MSEYSETFLDHYRRPRNLGDLEGADAVALVHEGTCGDVLRIAVRLSDREEAGAAPRRVVEARFKAYGCAAAIAAASVATEMILGATLEEAAALEEPAFVAALDGLPPRRLHAVALVRQALAELARRES